LSRLDPLIEALRKTDSDEADADARLPSNPNRWSRWSSSVLRVWLVVSSSEGDDLSQTQCVTLLGTLTDTHLRAQRASIDGKDRTTRRGAAWMPAMTAPWFSTTLVSPWAQPRCAREAKITRKRARDRAREFDQRPPLPVPKAPRPGSAPARASTKHACFAYALFPPIRNPARIPLWANRDSNPKPMD